MSNILMRLKTFNPVHHPILAVDTEDDGKGNFILGVVYGEMMQHGHNNVKQYNRVFTDKKELAEFLNGAERCVVVGKNIDYDLCNLEPYIHVKKLYAKARFIMGKNKKGTKFVDIGNHLFAPLADLMPMVGMKKLSLDNLEARCKSDAKATYLLACKLEDFYFRAGTRLKPTIGSCALEIFKRRFFKHFWKREDWENEFEREAYRGGRCELFNREPIEVKSFDANSMYLSVMRDNVFPDPTTARYYEDIGSFGEHFGSFQGIADVTVRVPERYYPPLPYYDPKLKKLLFPVGVFRGVYTFEELKMAQEYGATIKEVHRYCIYLKSFSYFRGYAEWIWAERQKTTNEFENFMIKRLGNSLYGKFGQKNDKLFYYGKLEDFKGKAAPGLTPHISTIGEVEYLSVTGGPTVDARHTFVIISAYIASFARIKLYREMIKYNTVYVDTDSIKFSEGLNSKPASSDELGGWKFEGEGLFQGYRPKLYEFRGKMKVKGVPKRNSEIGFTEDGLFALFKKPHRFKEALRRELKFNFWADDLKELDLFDDKRVWMEDGNSKPISISA